MCRRASPPSAPWARSVPSIRSVPKTVRRDYDVAMRADPGPNDHVRDRIAALLGTRVIDARSPVGGYTPAQRWIVTLADGRTAFAKTGIDVETSRVATWLRTEHRAYTDIHEAFMPRVLGWDDTDEQPLLLLEDLSGAHWPPPWSPEHIGAIEAMLESVARTTPPEWVDDLETRERPHLSGWARVQQDPERFLGLEICTEAWLARHIDTLLKIGVSAVLSGESLVHFDVRSDNLCLIQAHGALAPKIIDWNHLGRGSAEVDRVLWLSSLQREGGPPPWELVPDSRGISALLSGYFAAQAGLPPIPTAPGVRNLQREQLDVVLHWAIRELGLEPLDGVQARSTQ